MTMISAALLPAAALAAQTAAVAPAPVDYARAAPAAGAWSYRAIPGGSEALFVGGSGGVLLSVKCTMGTRLVTFSRTSAAPAATLTLWTSSAQRSLPARFEPNAMRVSADLAARDALLDAVAFSRGRFVVSMPGALPLVVSPGPEAARVFEDCRN